MTIAEPHLRRVGDRRTLLSVTLQQADSTGILAAMNLTGATVSFKMINAATGVTKIEATTTGVSVVSAAAGTVDYAFASTGVDEAGIFWGTFIVTGSGVSDSVPVRHNDLQIVIDSDTQSGKDAYAAAVA